MISRTSLTPRECAGEFIGTYVLVFFGTGVIHVAVLTGGFQGLWQIAVVWGIAISLAIYGLGAVSGAHINPALTLAFTVYRGFSRRKVLPYLASQLAGAFAAAATLYALFCHVLQRFEQTHEIVRGASGSQLSAMVYGEYFPNPALFGVTPESFSSVTEVQAMLAEGLGTAFLAFFVFALTDARNPERPDGKNFAVFIGLTVSIVICVMAPLTQAGLNPARDFGPRLFSYLAGWRAMAIPGPRGGFFTVYILSPMIGALAGAGMYQHVVHRRVRHATEAASHDQERKKRMRKIHLILVGGFLGAGKTTLLAHAAARLIKQGRRVGIITNDQAAGLVDTGIVRRVSSGVREVAGGCFCCRFGDLISSLKRLLADFSPDVVLAEPVGSCTDLSATVLQPLKKLYAEMLTVAPYSVLADPARLREVLTPGADTLFPESVHYIFRKQLEEADSIVLNKADLLGTAETAELEALVRKHIPGRPVLVLSALREKDVDLWLERTLKKTEAGTTIAEVDYDTYAEGEAELGWLNATVELEHGRGADLSRFCRDFLEGMRDALRAASAEIAHLKILLGEGADSISGNLTGLDAEPSVRGTMAGGPGRVTLLVNARVHVAPEALRATVERCLRNAAGDTVRVDVANITSFRPGRPEPTHRFDRVV